MRKQKILTLIINSEIKNGEEYYGSFEISLSMIWLLLKNWFKKGKLKVLVMPGSSEKDTNYDVIFFKES